MCCTHDFGWGGACDATKAAVSQMDGGRGAGCWLLCMLCQSAGSADMECFVHICRAMLLLAGYGLLQGVCLVTIKRLCVTQVCCSAKCLDGLQVAFRKLAPASLAPVVLLCALGRSFSHPVVTVLPAFTGGRCPHLCCISCQLSSGGTCCFTMGVLLVLLSLCAGTTGCGTWPMP